MARKRTNIRKFHRRTRINAGFLLFLVIFVYLLVSIIIYVNSDKTIIYQVDAGSLAVDNTYNGFIVRNESVINSKYSGSVSYFLKSKHKAGMNSLICSVDETGRVYEQLANSDTTPISGEDLKYITDKLASFTAGYDNDEFYNVYSVSDTVSSLLFESQSDTMEDLLDGIIDSTGSASFFHKIYPEKTGMIVYTVDGYESVTEENISGSLFDSTDYSSTNLQKEPLVNSGDPLYKLIENDDWYIYIRLTDDEVSKYKDQPVITVNFTDSNISTTASMEVINNNGENFGKISLSKYIINFADQRYIRIEVTQDYSKGLKIPKSSVITRNSYAIPADYMTQSGTFIREKYDENGQLVASAVAPAIYYADEDNYYVSTSDFESGDIIRKTDSDEYFVVGIIKELQGVYCVNRGYAVFKAVVVIDSNSEYYIVKRNSDYGLSRYDHIVLDHTKINESEILE